MHININVYKYVLETQLWDTSEEIRDVFHHCEMVCNKLMFVDLVA